MNGSGEIKQRIRRGGKVKQRIRGGEKVKQRIKGGEKAKQRIRGGERVRRQVMLRHTCDASANTTPTQDCRRFVFQAAAPAT